MISRLLKHISALWGPSLPPSPPDNWPQPACGKPLQTIYRIGSFINDFFQAVVIIISELIATIISRRSLYIEIIINIKTNTNLRLILMSLSLRHLVIVGYQVTPY